MPSLPCTKTMTMTLPMTPPPGRPGRRRPRLRAFLAVGLAAVAVTLLASAPAASAKSYDVGARTCVSLDDDYDLRNAARESDVLLAVHESDDKEAREQLCTKLAATPKERVAEAAEKGKGAVFAYIELDDDNRNFAKSTLKVKEFPAFLHVRKGMDRTAKFSDFVTHHRNTDSLDPGELYDFVEKKVGFRLGNDVFTVHFFDAVASRFVSYGDASGLDHIKQRLLALLVRLSTLFSWKEPFNSLGKLYNRAFSLSFTHGMEYSAKQIQKLEKKLKADVDEDKQNEISQKIAILRSFAEPAEVTPEDDRKILISAALHLGLLFLTLLLFFLPSGDDEEAGESEEKAVNDEPIISKPVE